MKMKITKVKYRIKEIFILSILFIAYLCLALRSFRLESISMVLFFLILAMLCLVMALCQMIGLRNKELEDREKIYNKLIMWISDILILLFVIPMGLSIVFYEINFGQRVRITEESPANMSADILTEESYFTSNTGQKLYGVFYYTKEESTDEVIVFCHGMGKSHKMYLDVIKYFVLNGYRVFSYDATGYDQSEGISIKGIPQSIIDLSYAITYVKEKYCKDIILMGHSLGGYAVCSVTKDYPDVKAVVSLAGFNRSIDVIAYQGEQITGPGIHLLLPFFSLYEVIKFGKYADYTGVDGLSDMTGQGMIIHSTDDTTVPIRIGYTLYEKRFGKDERFTFLKSAQSGHDGLFTSGNAERILHFLNDV